MSDTKVDFTIIGLPIPESMFNLEINEQINIYSYLTQLTEIQKKTYILAYNHLGTSFNIFRSNGYKEWIDKKK